MGHKINYIKRLPLKYLEKKNSKIFHHASSPLGLLVIKNEI